MRFRTLLIVAVLLAGLPARAQQAIQVLPTLETAPVPGTGTVVQGAALWPHPTDPANSVLLAADNQRGLVLYRTDGTEASLYANDGVALGVDVQEGVQVAGISQTLVMVANPTLQALVAYIIDPTTLLIRRAELPPITTPGFVPNSVALYVSPTTGRFFAFAGSATGVVSQFEFSGQVGDGGVQSTPVRTFDVGDSVVGLAVDDAQGRLYVVEQDSGIWEYGAEPNAADARTQVDGVTGGGLSEPLGGVALYTASGVRGYLLAVSGGENAVRIYEREPSAHTFRGSFTLVQDGGIDAVDASAPRGGEQPPPGDPLPAGHGGRARQLQHHWQQRELQARPVAGDRHRVPDAPRRGHGGPHDSHGWRHDGRRDGRGRDHAQSPPAARQPRSCADG